MKADTFARIRLKCGLTQAELAGLLDFQPKSVSRLECQQRNIRPVVALAMRGLYVAHIAGVLDKLLAQHKRGD